MKLLLIRKAAELTIQRTVPDDAELELVAGCTSLRTASRAYEALLFHKPPCK